MLYFLKNFINIYIEIYNTYLISSERSYSVKEIYMNLKKEIGTYCLYLYMPRWIALFVAHLVEATYKFSSKDPFVTRRNIRSMTSDKIYNISKAKKDLDFKQKIHLKEGLKSSVRYFMDEGLI